MSSYIDRSANLPTIINKILDKGYIPLDTEYGKIYILETDINTYSGYWLRLIILREEGGYQVPGGKQLFTTDYSGDTNWSIKNSFELNHRGSVVNLASAKDAKVKSYNATVDFLDPSVQSLINFLFANVQYFPLGSTIPEEVRNIILERANKMNQVTVKVLEAGQEYLRIAKETSEEYEKDYERLKPFVSRWDVSQLRIRY